MLNLFQFSLALILIYSGIFVGIALSKIAKEELKPGKKYFTWMKRILLILIFALPIILTNINLWTVRAAIIAAGFTIGVHIKKIPIDLELVYYPLFGILLALVSNNNNLLITLGALIFLYGLPTGSTLKKPTKKDLGKLTLYLIAALITFQLV